MSQSPVRTIICCAAILAGGAWFVTTDNSAKSSGVDLMSAVFGERAEADVAEPSISIAATKSRPAQEVRPQSASVVSIPRVQGQFFTQGRVNRASVRFLVDTGASAVALTMDDARRAGIDPRSLRYTVTVNTANGQTRAAAVRLDEIRIGGIVVRDVQGLVVPKGLHISLLGMSFLGELQKVEATPQQLILRY